MKIAFDARQAYHNGTGLGHYSRTLIGSLSRDFPGNEYFLLNTTPGNVFSLDGSNIREVLPHGLAGKLFPSKWINAGCKKILKSLGVEIYHGLDHMIPSGLKEAGIRSVVSIHDLIPERFPQFYKPRELREFRAMVKHACNGSDQIISISEQTSSDLNELYGVPQERLTVCYQSCNPRYMLKRTEDEKKQIKTKYSLPAEFFLYVSSIIERKNLLNICKAVFLLRNEIRVPLVVIGDGGLYKQKVKDFIRQNRIEDRVMFLTESDEARASRTFQTAEDLPAIYQSALAMIYPSLFEGFGIPVLEAMWSRLPVISSLNSSIPEVGGDAVHYVDPRSAEEIAEGMKKIYLDKSYAEELIGKGWLQAQKFTPSIAARQVMSVYEKVIN